MKIALIRRGFSASGGAEAYLRRLAEGLQGAGHEPVLVTTGAWPASAWLNESLVALNADSPAAFAVAARAAASGCDVVFSMERIGRCDIYRAGDGVHRAWQQRRRAFEPWWKHWLRIFNGKNAALLKLEQATFSKDGARRVIANSAMVRDEICAHFKFPEERMSVIPNGFDPPAIDVLQARGALRNQLRINDDTTVALFAGSGWERKGLRFAIEAVAELPSFVLVVAGKGNPHQTPPANVRYLGAVDSMKELYAAADVFVAPTIYDPFSNACLEALAAGLPVITSDANGFSEIIENGVHGTIVPVGNASAIRAGLVRWSAVREDANQQAICRVRAAEFSLTRNVTATLDIINRAAGR